MTEWKMTRHARERIQDMCLPPHVIKDVLTRPERTYDTRPLGHHDPRYSDEHRRMYVKGKVAILVSPNTRVIISALWATTEEYSREDLSKIWQDGGWTDY